MISLSPIALSSPNSSDAISEMLGIVAIFSFLAIAAFIILVYFLDSLKKNDRHASKSKASSSVRESSKTLTDFDADYAAEMKKVKEEFDVFYDETLRLGFDKFEDLVALAGAGLERISNSYGVNSVSESDQDREVRVDNYLNVCARQWAHFKTEMKYLSFGEVESNLRHILDSYHLMEAQKNGNGSSLEDNVDAESLRLQEIVTLAKGVPRDCVVKLQQEMLEAIEPFSAYYEKHVRNWLNDRLFRIMSKMKFRGEKGITIEDAGRLDQYRHLKNSMESVARLSERISQNTQSIGKEGIALSQIVYVGTVFDILSHLHAWFPSAKVEISPDSPAAEEPATDASLELRQA